MTTVAFAKLLVFGLTLVAVLAAAFVLGREALRRLAIRRALRRLEEARRVVDTAVPAKAAEVAAKLRQDFDPLTIERVVEQLLGDEAHRTLGAALFREVGLVERHGKRLREARAWAERTHAAQVLGLSGCAEAIAPLALALRDPHEDGTVKAAASEALARFQDAQSVPFLVRELQELDEGVSRPIAESLVRFGPVAVPGLIGVLADEAHGPARVWAARILGQIRTPDAVEPLVGLLFARDDLLRIAVASALGEIQDRRALQPLVQATLRDPAPQVRAHAAGAVARIAAEGAVDVLVAALADPDYVTRLRALEAFESIKLEDASALVRALRDPKGEVRRRAALALERVGYLDRVIGELSSADPRVSRDAYFKLLEIGRAGLVDGVVAFINHASFQVRAQAARAAGDLGATSAARLLFAALDDPEWPVRAAAADTVGRLRLEGGADRLVARLDDGEDPVREAAAEALEAFAADDLAGHARALAGAYGRGTIAVRLHMVSLLARVGGDPAAELLLRAATDPSETVRLAAVRAMGEQPSGERFLEPLVDRITDASLEVRTAAVAALGAGVTGDAFEALLRSLPGAPLPLRDRIAQALARGGRVHLFQRIDELSKVEDPDVRIGIAWTLGRIGEPAVAPYLARLLQAPEPMVRASAAGALAKVDAPASVDALLEACEDRDPRTRAAVLNALGKRGVGDARVAERIRGRLKDPDAFVRNRAALVLAKVAGAAAEAALGDPAIESLVAPAARLVGLALAGSEQALTRALDLVATPGALAAAITFLSHEGPEVRGEFLTRLRLPDPGTSAMALEDASIVPHYDTLLRSSLDIETRRIAVETLARVPGSLAIEVLADALGSDPAEPVRLATAKALSRRTRDERARGALVRAVADPSVDVACVAIDALQESQDRKAAAAVFQRLGATGSVGEAVEASLARMHRDDVLPLLDRIMGADRPEVIVAGLRVLERILSPDTLPLLELMLKSHFEDVRAATLAVLAKMPPQARIEATIDATLDDPSERVRRAAIAAIAAPSDAKAVRRLERVRIDPSASLRIELSRWLASTPEEPTFGLLRALVEDGALAVRVAALATLLERAEPRGLKLFLERWGMGVVELRADPRAEVITSRLALVLSGSSDPDARKAAVVGIAALRVPGFEKHVIPALRDPSPEVRVDAVRALAAHDDPEVRARIAELLEDPIPAVREAARRAPLRLIG